jgi:hypothetical protein
MTRQSGWRFAALSGATLGIGGALAVPPSLASPPEIKMADNATQSAKTGSFASAAEAEAFLTHALPAVTAANPKYRSPGSDVDRRWLIREIAFRQGENGGVIVSTHESIEDYRSGALTSEGTHEASFAIDDVKISDEVTDDIAENGEKARGVMFRCVGAPCIQAVWSGAKSVGAWTDVSIQDATQRKLVFAAFLALQRKAGPP